MLFKILKVTRMFIWRDIILFMNDPIEFVYLHGFSDASTLVYGWCIYIKSVSKAGNIKISLVTLKSRLLPFKKKFSMVHLELLGNFILAKLTMLFTMLCCRRLLFDLTIFGQTQWFHWPG